MPDTAQAIKDTLEAAWAVDGDAPHVGAAVVLHFDDDWPPSDDAPQLLVADDGGPRIFGGPWAGQRAPRRPLLRLTAFAKGRNKARTTVMDAADYVVDHHVAMGIARIEDVSDPLVTRDRATGAYLASVTLPAIVRPS